MDEALFSIASFGITPTMDCADLLRSNLPLIERLVRRICRHAALSGADVDDFSSTVKLALIENDYGILRAYAGRASLATYLTVVIQRLLANQHADTLGRWRASTEAKRLGDAAVLLEVLTRRDQRPMSEAIPVVRMQNPLLTTAEIEAIAARLPYRAPPPRAIALEAATEVASPELADAAAVKKDLGQLAGRASRIVSATIASLPVADRMLIRLRFVSLMSIADIARILHVPQRPLYRRLEQILAMLRSQLSNVGIDGGTAEDLIDSAVAVLDFGLEAGKMHGYGGPPVNSVSGDLEGRCDR